ncbi:MAG: hypothetical protein ABIZ80_10915 [Bryobacteraceae bacterium]
MRNKLLIQAMVAVGSAFIIVLSLAFVIHDYYPRTPDQVFGAIVAVVLVATAFGIFRVLSGLPLCGGPRGTGYWHGGGSPPVRRFDPEREARIQKIRDEAARTTVALRERTRLRIAELRADSARRKYAELVERGEEWSDEQIAYREDRNVTGTCPHLEAIERGMRVAGVAAKLHTEWWRKESGPLLKVKADCCVHESALRSQFALAESVRYAEGYQPERHHEDNPWAQLTCSACDSTIELVHSEWPRPATKWFPFKPA